MISAGPQFLCPVGNAQASIDSNQTADGPGLDDGFNQSIGPAAATPPIPAAVEAGATQFQQTFGRRLHSDAVEARLDSGFEQGGVSSLAVHSLSQAHMRREIAAHEAKLRDVLSEQQHL